MSAEITIVIADDHPVLRRGLRQIIEADAQLKVVAEADDGMQALTLVRELSPAVAVLDVDMPKLDGFGVAREMRKQNLATEIVFLTMHSEEDLFHAATELGVRGYVLKESAVTEIVGGIKAVAAGRPFVTSSLTAYLLERRPKVADSRTKLDALTPTERRILQMIAASKSSKEIAAELFVHYRTVENHRNNICQKLELHGHNALLKFALLHKSEI